MHAKVAECKMYMSVCFGALGNQKEALDYAVCARKNYSTESILIFGLHRSKSSSSGRRCWGWTILTQWQPTYVLTGV